MINNIKDLLIVKDNFFSDKIYKKIIYDISSLTFKNRSADFSFQTEIADNFRNNPYQKIYFHVPLNIDYFAVQEVSKLLNDYGFNVKTHEHNYFLSTKHEEASPHNDDNVDLNCIVFLKGKELINSGTGFYDKQEDGSVLLNRHIGFKENRAIIFDSRIFHASLQFSEGAGSRYIMSNFFKMK